MRAPWESGNTSALSSSDIISSLLWKHLHSSERYFSVVSCAWNGDILAFLSYAQLGNLTICNAWNFDRIYGSTLCCMWCHTCHGKILVGSGGQPFIASYFRNTPKCFLWPTFQISDGTTDPLPLALSGNNESFSDPAMTPFKHRHIKTLFKMSVGWCTNSFN